MRLLASVILSVLAVTLSACGDDSPNPGPSPTVYDIPTLQTFDTVLGTGTTATNGRQTTVHYTGWLYDPNAAGNKGTQVDSSVGRSPYSFVLGASSVIPGWNQGIVGMQVGGKRTLHIPSSLAYGERGNPPVPGGSALVFDIELLNVQ
jgi:FKBP-type peptidyl-prolyl cis-trans isomerase FkpA